MVRKNIFSISCIIIAALIGIYGQGLSYFCHGLFPNLPPSNYLTIFTLISIGMFIVTPTIAYFYKKRKNEKSTMILIASYMIGAPVSFWSIFVWGAWMG